MTAVVREVRGRELMRPRCLDAAIKERPHHIWIGPPRPGLWSSLARRQIRDMAHRVFVRIGALDRASKQLAAEIRPLISTLRPS